MREQVLRLDMPRALLVGERNLPYPDADTLAAGVKVLVVPGAGHAMMVDHPHGFARVLAEALGVAA